MQPTHLINMNCIRSLKNAGGSAPDLSKIPDDVDNQKMALRKRKITLQTGTNCDCVKNIADLRTDIITLLQDFTTSQNEHMTTMREDISQMKTQMNNIRSTTDYLVTEQSKILTEINDLKNQKDLYEMKIKSLENDINALKARTYPEPTSSLSTGSQEELLREINERSNREKNIIIIGVAELHGAENEDRRSFDEKEALNVIHETTNHVATSVKTSRLGKYKAGINRPLKVYFNSPNFAKDILRNKEKITNKTIKVISDQTPAQQLHMKELRQELQRRHENGEADLIIKYVKGYPKIVATTKN